MTASVKEQWAQLGARIDRRLKRPPRRPQATDEKKARSIREAKPDRAAELIAAETRYEAEMTERIKTEGAIIKAENLERMRLNDYGQVFVHREVKVHRLPER